MKVTIDIPKEFVWHYEDDKFSDSLQRLKNDIHLCAGNYEKEVVDMLIKAFRNAKEENMSKLPTPPYPRWKPDEDEYYYMLMGSGRASEWIWHADNDDGTSMNRYSIGNVYKTKEEVEFAAERLKVLAEMREWSGNVHFGAHIYYHRPSDQILIDWDGNSNYFYGDIRFNSVEDAENCIQVVGKDRIKKYYFMIPEDEK